MMESSKRQLASATENRGSREVPLSTRFRRGSIAFLLIGLAAIEAGYFLGVSPWAHSILAGNDTALGAWNQLDTAYHVSALLGFTLIAVLGLALFRLYWLQPALAQEDQIRALSVQTEDLTEQVGVLRNSFDRSNAQVKSTLADNRELRSQLTHLDEESRRVLRMRDALLESTWESTLLLDLNTRIVAASPAATQRLHKSQGNILGRVFDDAIPLYEEGKNDTQEHPIRGMVNKALAGDHFAPKMRECLLMTAPDHFEPVFVSVHVVSDTANHPIGAAVRLSKPVSTESGLDFEVPTPIADPNLAPQEQDWTKSLASRENFEQRLDQLVELAHEGDGKHALLLIGVDDFSRVMDTRGFWAAEQLLSHSARVLHEALQDSSTAYHLSAGRFAVLLSHTDLEPARQVAESVRDRASRSASAWEGASVGSTFSIAVLAIDKDSGGRTELLTLAESQLHMAKARNGNLVIHEPPDENVLARRRDDLGWLDWVQERIEKDQVHLTSQLVKSMVPDKKPLFEVLLRIEDDDGVWLTPQNYLPALERLQHTSLLDLWVLQQALDAFSENEKLANDFVAAQVNVSPASLANSDFAFNALERLMKPGAKPSLICFEIDEGTALRNSTLVQKFIETVRPSGARISLDGCQTTMGISHLRDLPLDYVKIHSRLVQRIERDMLDRKHLEWINEAAHLAGRQTCALGVESSDTLELLRKIGVDYAQGMAVSKFGPLIR